MRTLLYLSLAVFTAALAGEEWTRFRGPTGRGVVEDAKYPDELNKQKNLVWRTPVRPGKSSPILTARHVLLTAFENGKLYTQCFDRKTGKLLWERSVDKSRDEVANRLNHAAAPSPVTDGENVYVLFKDFGFVSYDLSGKERWRIPTAPFKFTMGLGASPILTDNAVILLADQVEDGFIAAFDKRNGELRWRIGREESEAWGTPLYFNPTGKNPFIVTASRGQLGVHSVSDGKRLSTLHGIPLVIVGSPFLENDILYVQGYGSEEPQPFSSRLQRLDKNKDGKLTADEIGDDPFLIGIAKFKGNRDMVITEEEWLDKQKDVLGSNCLAAYKLEPAAGGKGLQARELWRQGKNFTGVIPTPISYRGVVYYVKNGGILTSVNAQTGEAIKTGRVTGALGGYSSSPVAADGKLYLASEDGHAAVLKAGGEWEVLSVTDFDEPSYATPALSEGSVFLRTDAALYRFGK